MKVHEYNDRKVTNDMDVTVEYCDSITGKVHYYQEVRNWNIDRVVKYIDDNKFKLMVYISKPNEPFDEMRKDLNTLALKWKAKFCDTCSDCNVCPFHKEQRLKYNNEDDTRCALLYISKMLKNTLNSTINYLETTK